MQILSNWPAFPAQCRGGVLCVGKFDGVHIGHRKMLSTGREEATRRGMAFTIMTFEPHPNAILKPEIQHRQLTTHEQRLEILASFNPDIIIVIPTSREFLSMTAEEFLRTIVSSPQAIEARLLVEGPSFTFGRGARGNVDTLRHLGPGFGFETIIVPTQQQTLSDLTIINVSSSLIRWLIEQGRVTDASRAIGRPYTLRGTVVEGKRRGRALGFPTANLQTPQLLPAPGVYAGFASAGDHVHRAAISVGKNLTFGAPATTVEAFLLDFPPPGEDPRHTDLYGQTIDLAFTHWLRDMFSFGGPDPLVAQMARDVALTRQLVSRHALTAAKEPA